MISLKHLALTLTLLGQVCHAAQGSKTTNPTARDMTFTFERPDPLTAKVVGTAWKIYLSGVIQKDTPRKFEEFLQVNDVPVWSFVFLNSPGGDLFGGMELGRVFRKHSLFTYIGLQADKNEPRREQSGVCYSACAYAFLGGTFRFWTVGSHYGVHRFYSAGSSGDMDRAQIISALIANYVREMGIDGDLFSISTIAGPDDIYEPPLSLLKQLSVVNDGFGKTVWSVESNEGALYLKGERDTVYGINKFMVGCSNNSPIVTIIIDPQGRQKERALWEAQSLVIDAKPEPIKPRFYEIMPNGTWLWAMYTLSGEQISRLLQACSVGMIYQMSYDAPVFHGFMEMPFDGAAGKLVGILNHCK